MRMQHGHSQHTDSQHGDTVDGHTKVLVFISTFLGNKCSAPGKRKCRRILEMGVFSHAAAHIHDWNWCRSKFVASPFRMVAPVTETQTTATPLYAHVGSSRRVLHTVTTLTRMPVCGLE